MEIRTDSGRGSGWVYEEGWIITADHVVEGREEVTVFYENRQGEEQSVPATVRGRDSLLDLAALQVTEPADLPEGTARSRRIYTRDTGLEVMSLGYASNPPTGWPNVRVGILTTSGLYTLPPNDQQIAALESDAAFDPGDSGGPVLTREGRIIGMVQAGRARTWSGQRVQGRQKALSIDMIEEVWDQLMAGQVLNSAQDYWWSMTA